VWDAVKARQQAVEDMSVKIRGAVRGNGPVPRHLLSGLLICQQCGGAFRRVNGREYGCATHKDGGDAACSNGIRVPGETAERKLLDEVAREMLSPEGVAFLERRVREHVRKAGRAPKAPTKPQEAQLARKRAEIDQLRALMKAGTLSQAVAQAAIEKAEEEVRAIERLQPERDPPPATNPIVTEQLPAYALHASTSHPSTRAAPLSRRPSPVRWRYWFLDSLPWG
jgi:hypothetical protein